MGGAARSSARLGLWHREIFPLIPHNCLSASHRMRLKLRRTRRSRLSLLVGVDTFVSSSPSPLPSATHTQSRALIPYLQAKMAAAGRHTPEAPGVQKTAPSEPAQPAPAQQFILEGVFHQAAKLGFLAWILAWILSSGIIARIPYPLLCVRVSGAL